MPVGLQDRWEMKQRIRTVAIIRNENGVLILKRNRGRSEAPVFWELPTSKIKFGEQPEEAMVRHLSEYLGVSVSSMKIKDVITFLALEGASRLSNLYIIYDVSIRRDSKLNPKDRYTAYKFIKEIPSPGVNLNEASISVLEITESRIVKSHFSARDSVNAVSVYVDGASRGNPGPSGIGYRILSTSGSNIEQGGEFIGFATSRVAEYYALKKGIERCLELGINAAHFYSDSLMVVNQMNGIFAVKNRDILPIYDSIQKLLERFDSISFTHISRSSNHIADYEANLAIDNIISKR